jgi:DDE superfamily endonuclease
MDEHRVGLKPILRRVWSLRGQRPILPVQQRYEWLYVYGFVQPATGRNFWLLMPSVSVSLFSTALAHFADFMAATTRAQVELVLDRAGWHTSPRVVWPSAIRPDFLPPYSPELQPAEHLWRLSDAPLFNRHFLSLDALQHVLAERCRWLQDQLEIVRSATLFPWWSDFA